MCRTRGEAGPGRAYEFACGGLVRLTVHAADLAAAREKALDALRLLSRRPAPLASFEGVLLELAHSEIALGDDANWSEV